MLLLRDLAASTPELTSLSTSSSSGVTVPISPLWLSASSIRLDLAREDLVLLGLLGLHLTEAAARFLANSQELPAAPPQSASREASGGHAPQICVALDHLEAAMHCGAVPLLKLAIDDTFIAVDSEFKAPLVVVRSASLAHYDTDLGDWVSTFFLTDVSLHCFQSASFVFVGFIQLILCTFSSSPHIFECVPYHAFRPCCSTLRRACGLNLLQAPITTC